MKKYGKRATALGLALITGSTLMLGGCQEKTPELESTVVPMAFTMDSAAETVLYKDGMVQSDLTGEWVTPEQNNKRPVAIMINNVADAIPQSGIGQADIIYEMVVEGSITRLEAVFSDYSGLDKIGPVRSARQYYVRNAEQLDAIFAHIGTSTLADQEIAKGLVDDMDGMTGLGNVFIYRDNARVAPHNAYTSEDGLNQAIAQAGFETEHGSSYTRMFMFNQVDKAPEAGATAKKVVVDYHYNHPWFEYNEESKEYDRFQLGEAQIDDQTGEQLHFKNLIVCFANIYNVDGYLMETVNTTSGDGFYATDGVYIPITWRYESGTIHYYTADGKQLMMNPGKTFISWYYDDERSGVTFE